MKNFISFPVVNQSDYQKLKESLNFLKVKELRIMTSQLGLVNKGTKSQLMKRILHYLQTGEKTTPLPFPSVSCARRGQAHLIKSSELMLKGAYRNDLETRVFFKNLIGGDFHFTAFGIDWLNKRWMAGDPPTYQEFADMWKEEYHQRKGNPAPPKEEWAYINFVQNFLRDFAGSSRARLNAAWETERQKHRERINIILKTLPVA